jgi:hypothetical protein
MYGWAPGSARGAERINSRLRRLSEEYGLASTACSLVAVVKRAGDKPGMVPRTRVVPVGMPEDTAFNLDWSRDDRRLAVARFKYPNNTRGGGISDDDPGVLDGLGRLPQEGEPAVHEQCARSLRPDRRDVSPRPDPAATGHTRDVPRRCLES